MRIEVVGADTISQQARTYADIPGVRCTHAVRECRESPTGSRGTAPAEWRARPHRVHGDGVIGRGGLDPDTSKGSPRLRCDQSRDRTYQNHGGDGIGRRSHFRLRSNRRRDMHYCVVPCALPCYGSCEVLHTGRGIRRAESIKIRSLPTTHQRGSSAGRRRASSSKLPSPSIARSGRNRE